jgi:hypothetical protein
MAHDSEIRFCQVENSFYAVNGSWRRRDVDGFGLWVAYDGDMSPAVECHTNYLPDAAYNSDCGYCYLGHAHSMELHTHELERKNHAN